MSTITYKWQEILLERYWTLKTSDYCRASQTLGRDSNVEPSHVGQKNAICKIIIRVMTSISLPTNKMGPYTVAVPHQGESGKIPWQKYLCPGCWPGSQNW